MDNIARAELARDRQEQDHMDAQEAMQAAIDAYADELYKGFLTDNEMVTHALLTMEAESINEVSQAILDKDMQVIMDKVHDRLREIADEQAEEKFRG